MKTYCVILNTSFELGGTPTYVSLPPSSLSHANISISGMSVSGTYYISLCRQKAEKCAEDDEEYP
jgi:hypothetical protein